jgi:hypothetical protein
VEALVNHVSGVKAGVAGVYNKASYLEERRQALAAWALLVDTAGGARFSRLSAANRSLRNVSVTVQPAAS